MTAILDASPSATRRRLVWWAIVAAVNVAAGMWLATSAARTDDFLTVVSWASAWLERGANLYSPEWFVDYPPHAIVALSPLALLPSSVLVPFWVALNVILALTVPVLAARAVREGSDRLAVLELTLLFLCWSGTKIFTQYSLLAMVLGLGAVVTARRRPLLSGFCLGLSAMKPQIGIPFALALVLTWQWRAIAAAALVVLVGWLVFALRAGVGFMATVTAYVDILRTVYTGASAQVGASSLQPLLVQLLPPGVADLAAVLTALILFAVIVWMGTAVSRREDRAAVVCALGGVWSLLTFYHLTYGFVLLLPAAAWLRLRPAFARGSGVVLFWVLQLLLIVDMPGVGRRLGGRLPSAVNTVMSHADRGLALLLFAALAVLAIRARREAGSNQTQIQLPGQVGLQERGS